jgi:hypothetical protein
MVLIKANVTIKINYQHYEYISILNNRNKKGAFIKKHLIVRN